MSNLEIKVARTEDEFNGVYELRYHVFGMELKYIDVSKYPDKKEKDEFDDLQITTNFIAKKNGKVIGTFRLIQSSDRKFNIEKYVKVRNGNGIVWAEGSRLCVDEANRGKKAISYGLCKILINYAHLKGITDVCVLANATNEKIGNTVKFGEKIGFYPFSETIYYKEFNEYATPLRIVLKEVPEPMRTWFKKPSEFIEKPYHIYLP